MKKVIRIITVCLILVTLASLLVACKEEDTKDLFTGTWKEVDADSTMVFASDGSGSISEGGVSGSLRWKKDGDKLFITVSLCGMSETNEYTYAFSDNTMILTDVDGNETVYQKGE